MMHDLKADISLALMQHVQKTGRAIEILRDLERKKGIPDLSKHNDFWNTEELDDLRGALRYIFEKIGEVQELLDIDPFEGNL